MSGGALAGRVALVTGASRGIGEAAAEALAGAGARVARVARSLEPGPRGPYVDFPCDLVRPEEVERTAAAVIRTLGVPDLLVSNAGNFVLKPLEATTPEEFEASLAVNLTGAFLLLRLLVPPLKARGRGHVVTVGSIADHVAFPGNAAYGAAKWGLRGLHEVLATELKPAGIRCTLISPGPTDTALWDGVPAGADAGLPSRRAMLLAADVAEAILFAATRPPRANVDLLYLNPSA